MGAGLAQQSYELAQPDSNWSECSYNWKGACAENWAHRIAGERISQIQRAADHRDLVGQLANSPPIDGATRLESRVGFASHVQTVGEHAYVLADGFNNVSVGKSATEWLRSVGLSVDALISASALSGYTWLGPFNRFQARPGVEPAPHYLLFVPVPVEDRLTSSAGDGIGDQLVLIVPVSAFNPQWRLVPSTSRTGSQCVASACVGYAEFQQKCKRSSRTDACPVGVTWDGADGTAQAQQCVQKFFDTEPFGANSLFGLQSWVDSSEEVPMCGCVGDYEAVLVPESISADAPAARSGTSRSLCAPRAQGRPRAAPPSVTFTQPIRLRAPSRLSRRRWVGSSAAPSSAPPSSPSSCGSSTDAR